MLKQGCEILYLLIITELFIHEYLSTDHIDHFIHEWSQIISEPAVTNTEELHHYLKITYILFVSLQVNWCIILDGYWLITST